MKYKYIFIFNSILLYYYIKEKNIINKYFLKINKELNKQNNTYICNI